MRTWKVNSEPHASSSGLKQHHSTLRSRCCALVWPSVRGCPKQCSLTESVLDWPKNVPGLLQDLKFLLLSSLSISMYFQGSSWVLLLVFSSPHCFFAGLCFMKKSNSEAMTSCSLWCVSFLYHSKILKMWRDYENIYLCKECGGELTNF